MCLAWMKKGDIFWGIAEEKRVLAGCQIQGRENDSCFQDNKIIVMNT